MTLRKKIKIKPTEPLSKRDFKILLKYLPFEIRIIAQAYREACYFCSSLGLNYYWHEMFVLTKNLFNKSDYGPATIIFARSSRYGTEGEDFCATCIPESLEKSLLKHVKNTNGVLLFQNKNGQPHTTKSIGKAFRIASKLAIENGEIKSIISPIQLRISPQTQINLIPIFDTAVTDERLEKVNSILNQKKQNIGCSRRYKLKTILEAILNSKKYFYSRNQCKELYPCASAAESQLRRWKKAGIWDQILKVFQE
jgi:hypothetical protein